MATIGSTIADAAQMGPRYAKRLASGIPAERFARMSQPGGQLVEANHPAFALGHLCLYPFKVLDLLGMDTTEVMPPDSFEALFSKTAKCIDDPSGKIYPSSEVILSFFESSYSIAIDAIRRASDEKLSAPNPIDTPMREILPTLGGLLAFYLTGHVTTHLGQLSTWRRMEGLPAA